MKGIFLLRNGSGHINGYYASQDLDADREYFDSGDYQKANWWYRIGKYQKSLTFEIVKETDNPEYDVLEYILPQVSRITYQQELLDAIAEGRIKVSRLKKAAEWFCEAYPTQYYSMEFYSNGRRKIYGELDRKGEKVGLFSFSKKGATAIDEDKVIAVSELSDTGDE